MATEEDDMRQEIEQGTEEFLGQPYPRTPAQGIADMTTRIAYLRRQLSITEDAPETRRLNQEIIEAELHLREYQTQAGSN